MKFKFKNNDELKYFLDPRNKVFVDWTTNTITIRGPRLE